MRGSFMYTACLFTLTALGAVLFTFGIPVVVGILLIYLCGLINEKLFGFGIIGAIIFAIYWIVSCLN